MVVGRVRDETARLDTVAVWVHRRKTDLRHERGDPRLVSGEEWISQHHSRVGAVAAGHSERLVKISLVVHLQNPDRLRACT